MRNSRTAAEGRKEVEGDTSFVVLVAIWQEGIFVAGSLRRSVLSCGNSSYRPPRSIRASRYKPASKRCDVPCSWLRADALRRVCQPRGVPALPNARVPAQSRQVLEITETDAEYPRSQYSQARSHGDLKCDGYRRPRRRLDDFRHKAESSRRSQVQCHLNSAALRGVSP